MAYVELVDVVARTVWRGDLRRARVQENGLAVGERRVGEVGDKGEMGGRGRENEFQMREHLTCTHEGPWVEFRERSDLKS